MSVLLHISDPHFGTEQAPVVEALYQLAKVEQPEVVVWSGDITQRARHAQFEAARRFADRLAPPHTLVIPGNHDIPLFNLFARVGNPYGGFKAHFGNQLSPCLSLKDWLVLGVNTTRPWRHKNGDVSPRQIEAVSRALQAGRPEQLKLVVVHQPIRVPTDKDRHNLLRGHDVALRTWAQAGADLILGGHIHLPYVLPPSFGNTWVVQAGTSLSSRVRGGIPNSVNLIRYTSSRPGRAIIERWDHNAEKHCFEMVLSVASDEPQVT